MKQAALDFDLDPAHWPAPAPPAAAPPAETTPVYDGPGRRVGTVTRDPSQPKGYPYVASCDACGARQAGWAQSVGGEMWARHHAAAQCSEGK